MADNGSGSGSGSGLMNWLLGGLLLGVVVLGLVVGAYAVGYDRGKSKGSESAVPAPPPATTETTTTGETTTGETTTGETTTGETTTGENDLAAQGAEVFASNGCGSCHTLAAANASGSVGPNLDTAKPSEALIIDRVTNGFGAMPSFKDQLSETQIKAVATYISQAAGG